MPARKRKWRERWATTVAAIVLLVLLFSSATAAQEEGAAATELPASVEVGEPPADIAIRLRLQRILDATGWFEAPSVRVEHGVVTLEGVAETQEQRRWAAELAGRAEGVVAVVNRLEIASDFGSIAERAAGEFERLGRQALSALPLLALAAIILVAAWLVAKLVALLARKVLRQRVASPLLLSVLVRALSIPVLLLGLYFVLQIAGLTRLALTVLGGTGLIGIIVGFAFRDIAENFLASLLLSARNPFRSGDLVEVAGHTGIVQNLNTRSTVLLTLDGNHVQIPNATVYKGTIKNFSASDSRRTEFTVGISYESPTAKAQALIAEVLRVHPAVLAEPEPLVLVEELGAATVNLRVYYWFDSATYSPIKINSALLRLTKNALLGAGIEMPDTEREIVFPQGVPLVSEPGKAVERQRPAVNEEADAVTAGEGDLSSETPEIEETGRANIPEADRNLLKS